MTPEEFRKYGHQLIDWVADYRANIAARPVMARTKPGEVRAQLPKLPPDKPEEFGAIFQDLDQIVMPGLSHWQHPQLFRIFPVEWHAGERAGRLPEHGTRRAGAFLAIQSRADGSGRGDDGLGAQMSGLSDRVERGDPGYGINMYAAGI